MLAGVSVNVGLLKYSKSRLESERHQRVPRPRYSRLPCGRFLPNCTSQGILHGMSHASGSRPENGVHMPPLASVLLKQKLINVQVTFDLSHLLLTEARSDCKSREHMPSDTQAGVEKNMGSAIFWCGNSPWSSQWSNP